MPVQHMVRKNGASAPPRRWLLSAPVPLPALGDYGQFTAVYDLDRVMDLDVAALVHDLTQQGKTLTRQRDALLAELNAAWDDERKAADPDAWDEADYQTGQAIRALTVQRVAINRAINLRILAEILIDVQGPDGVEIADPTNAHAWDGWSNHILMWLVGDGMRQARGQLDGPKS